MASVLRSTEIHPFEFRFVLPCGSFILWFRARAFGSVRFLLPTPGAILVLVILVLHRMAPGSVRSLLPTPGAILVSILVLSTQNGPRGAPVLPGVWDRACSLGSYTEWPQGVILLGATPGFIEVCAPLSLRGPMRTGWAVSIGLKFML